MPGIYKSKALIPCGFKKSLAFSQNSWEDTQDSRKVSIIEKSNFVIVPDISQEKMYINVFYFLLSSQRTAVHSWYIEDLYRARIFPTWVKMGKKGTNFTIMATFFIVSLSHVKNMTSNDLLLFARKGTIVPSYLD